MLKETRWHFSGPEPCCWSDEAWDTDAEAESGLKAGRMYNGNASAADHPVTGVSADSGNGNYWAAYWNAIRNCTIFIARIDQATVTSAADRKRWKAEAHLLRAYYYSELLKWFGPSLPIEREAYDFGGDFSSVKRESYYNVVKFIMEDCDVALATSELPWRIASQGEGGHINKATAEANRK